jgi:hypothetical protein
MLLLGQPTGYDSMDFLGTGRDKIPMSTGNTRENRTGNKNGGSRTK